MKILITTTDYVRTEKEIEVNIPEKQLYLWHNGIRRAYSVKPKWTSWNVENHNKPEEIYSLKVVMVDPSSVKVEVTELTISSLAEIIKNDKHPYKRLVENILLYPDDKEYIRTKEQFENDLQVVLKNIDVSSKIEPQTPMEQVREAFEPIQYNAKTKDEIEVERYDFINTLRLAIINSPIHFEEGEVNILVEYLTEVFFKQAEQNPIQLGKEKTAEEMLVAGLDSGDYDNITSNPSYDITLPYYRTIIRFAEEYASQSSQKEVVEWIDVNDNLPEESCSVIVATDKNGIGYMWFSKELKWHKLRDDAQVTHWMKPPNRLTRSQLKK